MQSTDQASAQYTGPVGSHERRVVDGPVIGGARWLGVHGDAAVSEMPADRPCRSRDSTFVIGAAHGPRLLEILRAAC
jgi:hypothetical protein